MKKGFLFGVVFFLLGILDVSAVIVSGGDGTQNTTAPSGDRGWSSVGRIQASNGAYSSVTYLSNNWFITAYHVKHYDNPTGVVLGASSYLINASSWTRLTNSTGSNADLILFRVGGTVSESSRSIVSSAPSRGSALSMIGNGRNRETSLTYWDDDGSAWNEVSGPTSDYSGYKYARGSTKRWGNNTLEGTYSLLNDGFGYTDMIYTDFDAVNGEAHAATYDSGGGVFVQNGSDWELAGIMLTTDELARQPNGTVVYGNTTYAGDLSSYADQINDALTVPEPTVAILGLLAPTLAYFIRRFFRI